ncbi:MAG: cation:dicarboxylase symporter family transporter, partial [Gemmatimonadales bacterium]
MQLYTKITIALILGVVAGLVANALAIDPLTRFLVAIEPIGTAWIRLITMVVVPLVFASLIVGTASLGDITKLGRIGSKTVIYYMATTAIAVTIGLLLSNLIQPGARMSPEGLEALRVEYTAARHGVMLREIAGGVTFAVADDCAEDVRRLTG